MENSNFHVPWYLMLWCCDITFKFTGNFFYFTEIKLNVSCCNIKEFVFLDWQAQQKAEKKLVKWLILWGFLLYRKLAGIFAFLKFSFVITLSNIEQIEHFPLFSLPFRYSILNLYLYVSKHKLFQFHFHKLMALFVLFW